MDGFRKPYEYEEEKRGAFLLVFIILLVSIEIFISISLIAQGYDVARLIPLAGTAFLVAGVMYVMFLLYTVMTCYKVGRHMIGVAKIFLVVRAVFNLFCLTIIYVHALGDTTLIGNGFNQFESKTDLSLVIFILPAVYMLVFSMGWFLYFHKSKKCREMVAAKYKVSQP